MPNEVQLINPKKATTSDSIPPKILKISAEVSADCSVIWGLLAQMGSGFSKFLTTSNRINATKMPHLTKNTIF